MAEILQWMTTIMPLGIGSPKVSAGEHLNSWWVISEAWQDCTEKKGKEAKWDHQNGSIFP